MIFPNLEIESVVQIGDRTRLSAVKSYGSKGATITKVEIEAEASAGFIDVTGTPIRQLDWFTDWEYSSAGTKTMQLKINGGSPSEIIITKTIEVITEAADMLFASDNDLVAEEPDILKYVRAGRNSFKDVHREVQKQILDLLNRKGYLADGAAITKDVVEDHTQVREMAKYLALHIIFEGVSNQVGDVFSLKSQEYRSEYTTAIQRQLLGLDLNKDGNADVGEGVMLSAAKLVRR